LAKAAFGAQLPQCGAKALLRFGASCHQPHRFGNVRRAP
jgi:hypothetical protein